MKMTFSHCGAEDHEVPVELSEIHGKYGQDWVGVTNGEQEKEQSEIADPHQELFCVVHCVVFV